MRPENSDQRDSYVQNLFAQSLANARESLPPTLANKQGMQISPEEAKLLQCLITIASVSTIVEIGTFVGYSTIAMASALPSNGKIYTIEFNKTHAEIARTNIAKSLYHDRITLLEGNAVDILRQLPSSSPFDMIFIDADKAAYPQYLDWAEQHIKKGGLIIGDNTFLFGSVYLPKCPENVSEKSWEAMRCFNQRLSDPNLYESILLPTHEGMTIAYKKF